MGRPREMTEEQRADLEARGYRLVELWVLDRNSESYRREIERQMNAVAEADLRDPNIDDWVVQVRGDLWDDPA